MKAFTLIELIVVIIIIGILATLGITQYGRMLERSRGGEAKNIAGQIRIQASAYYLEFNDASGFNTVRAGIGTVADQIPSACASTHYFSYGIVSTANTVTVTATRCGAGGRGGNNPAAGRQLILQTVLPGGTDTWTGDGGY